MNYEWLSIGDAVNRSVREAAAAKIHGRSLTLLVSGSVPPIVGTRFARVVSRIVPDHLRHASRLSAI